MNEMLLPSGETWNLDFSGCGRNRAPESVWCGRMCSVAGGNGFSLDSLLRHGFVRSLQLN